MKLLKDFVIFQLFDLIQICRLVELQILLQFLPSKIYLQTKDLILSKFICKQNLSANEQGVQF